MSPAPDAFLPAPMRSRFGDALRFHLRHTIGADDPLGPRDVLHAASLAVRDELVERLGATRRRNRLDPRRMVAYVSMEFLMGRSLVNNLIALGLLGDARDALAELGHSIEAIAALEDDAALGNGGLGRLAACFLDSMATLDLPAIGYGLAYEYGLFQRERPDTWGRERSPWLIERPQESILVPLYGRVENQPGPDGTYNPMWLDWKLLVGVPADFPIVGHGGKTVNALRLFSARTSGELDMRAFNPDDRLPAGRELRLVQEYFLSACAVRDVARRCLATFGDLERIADCAAIQLNDTHPALVVAELMRLLVDEHGLEWERAWELTQATTAYTNHTLMPEALERWPVPLLARVIPRHLELIYEINRRFLDDVEARWPGDGARAGRMSLIEESEPKHVRMAHLAIVGSHSVNGVAAMHSELVKHELVPDFHAMWPDLFNNKTNGVTPRRWLLDANPGLAALLDQTVGADWVTDLDRVGGIAPLAGDPGFAGAFARVKRANKVRLAEVIHEQTGWVVSPDAMFDVHVKRIHEYKRQLLNILDVIRTYDELVTTGRPLPGPRVVIFAGKAAPGDDIAKRVIHLINAVAERINRDPRVGDQLKVVFLPDYRVSLAERIVPAADLSEQISTAGTEASGTGNMKMAINGAVTLGTLDGTNVEIRDAVGDDNIFVFGQTVEQVRAWRACGYDPRALVDRDAGLRRAVSLLTSEALVPRHRGAFEPLRHRLLDHGDEYFVLADLVAYGEARARAAAAYLDRPRWLRMAITNTARTGWFSSDRTIREYAADVWRVTPR